MSDEWRRVSTCCASVPLLPNSRCRCRAAPGATFKAAVRFSVDIYRTPAKDIMNDQAPQGTHLEAAVLAHPQMDLYTPPHQANEQKAETFRASQYASTYA
jgi:hypothetical protein